MRPVAIVRYTVEVRARLTVADMDMAEWDTTVGEPYHVEAPGIYNVWAHTELRRLPDALLPIVELAYPYNSQHDRGLNEVQLADFKALKSMEFTQGEQGEKIYLKWGEFIAALKETGIEFVDSLEEAMESNGQ